MKFLHIILASIIPKNQTKSHSGFEFSDWHSIVDVALVVN
jgi:hypothetical protein